MGEGSPAGLIVFSRLLESADRLERTVLRGSFPDLDDDPTSDDEVRSRVALAAEWERLVRNEYGPGPRVIQVSEQRPLLGWFRGTTSEAGPCLDSADDVLGLVPDLFQECMAYMICELDGGLRPLIGHESITLTVGEWPKIRADLEEARKLITMQALGVINWVRSRIQMLERPAMPRVTWKAPAGSRGSVLLAVDLAGFRREIELESSPFELLFNLVAHGTAKGTRMDKSRLVEAIPELSLWIKSAPRTAGLAESEARYVLAEEVRSLIQVQQPGTEPS